MMQWLTGNWNLLLPGPWAAVTLVMISAICGLLVGAEREVKEKSAGLRTLTLVCVGAAVFTLMSVIVAASQGDRGRIASQVVVGVGFLGAGAILRGSEGVRGMTTAASIWSVAAIGMVVGAGYPVAGLALSLLMLTVLRGVAALERRYIGPCVHIGGWVLFRPEGGRTLVRIRAHPRRLPDHLLRTQARPGRRGPRPRELRLLLRPPAAQGVPRAPRRDAGRAGDPPRPGGLTGRGRRGPRPLTASRTSAGPGVSPPGPDGHRVTASRRMAAGSARGRRRTV